jgi:hypothetical protein
VHLTRSSCEGSNALDEFEDHTVWNDCAEDGDIRSEWVWGRWRHWICRWKQWHWLLKVERIWHTLCIKCFRLIVKYFFLTTYYILGGSSYIWINTFSLGRHDFLDVCLRLDSCCILVNMVYRIQSAKTLLAWNKVAACVTSNVWLPRSECCSITYIGLLDRTVSLIQTFFELGKKNPSKYLK